MLLFAAECHYCVSERIKSAKIELILIGRMMICVFLVEINRCFEVGDVSGKKHVRLIIDSLRRYQIIRP